MTIILLNTITITTTSTTIDAYSFFLSVSDLMSSSLSSRSSDLLILLRHIHTAELHLNP